MSPAVTADTDPSSRVLPTPALRRRLPGTFRALRHRNYRLYFLGQMVSLTGSWVQTTALTWLAWDLTHASRWPALVGAAQILPTCLLGGLGGSLADRCSRRGLLLVTQASLLVLAFLLAALVLAGQVTPWHLLAVAVVAGVVNALDLPTRLTFVMDMVGRDDLVNAIALNSLSFNVARALGPALGAAVLRAVGPGPCFLLNSLSFVAVLAALAAMRLPPEVAAPRPGAGESLMAGFRFLARRRALVLLLVMAAVLSLFGWPLLSLLPALSDRRLGTAERGYGWMLSAFGTGALLAALAIASFGSARRRNGFLIGGTLLTVLSLAGLTLTCDLHLAAVCCGLCGMGLVLFFVTGQAAMQMGAAAHNRGRIMGIWSMITCGALPLGNLLAGLAADCWGVARVLTLQAVGITVAAAVVVALVAAGAGEEAARPAGPGPRAGH